MRPSHFRILVLGGYGNFGKRISESLAREPNIHLIIAGRSQEKASQLSTDLQQGHPALSTEAAALDIEANNVEQQLAALAPNLVIHTSGPFQGQTYRVPKACISIGAHYIDLADDRRFVCDITQLDKDAKEAGVLIVSGASSVPGLSSAVVDHFLPEFKTLERIDYAIAPGNRLERGFATIKAILSYTGHPFTTWKNGKWQQVYGWMDSVMWDLGEPVGRRHLANIDIPDLELFPDRYAPVNTVRFKAGLELPAMHHFMVFMAWLAKKRIIKNWAACARMSMAISHWFYYLGTDVGGMQVKLSGKDHSDLTTTTTITWTLIAENGVGPYIPTIPAIMLANGIVSGAISSAGATPCTGLISLSGFLGFAEHWGIYSRTQ